MIASSIPNFLTVFRFFLVYPIVISILEENYQLTLFFFFLAGISDFLDGYLARKYSWESRFGKIFDPISDKVLVIATLISLSLVGEINIYLTMFLLSRDLFIIVGVITIIASGITTFDNFEKTDKKQITKKVEEIKKPEVKVKKETKKPELKVKRNNVAEVILPDLNLKTETVIQLFKDVDYDLKKVRNEKLVKPIYFTQFPRDLDNLQNVQLKKETFIKIVLPLIVAENEKLRDNQLENLKNSSKDRRAAGAAHGRRGWDGIYYCASGRLYELYDGDFVQLDDHSRDGQHVLCVASVR